jgi:hypothetical protein
LPHRLSDRCTDDAVDICSSLGRAASTGGNVLVGHGVDLFVGLLDQRLDRFTPGLMLLNAAKRYAPF